MNLLYIIGALLILSVIVMVHELGHYIAGRLCGIGIVEFAVGMGPKLFGWERKGIKYSVRAIPIGGFCAFVGEDDENPAPNAMNNMPVWKRFITVASGPIMNFVLAYLVCAVLLANFMNVLLMPRIDAVIEDMPAIEAGFEVGDIVVALDGTEISYDNEGAELMRSIVQAADDSTVLNFTVKRGDELINIELSPALVPVTYINSQTGEEYVQDTYQIGIQFGSRNYTFAESLGESGRYMVSTAKMMLESIKNLVFKGEGINDVSGPVGIVSMMSQQISEGMYMILYLVFIISLNLGIMNLLPLPALDGGRLVFLIIEGIIRKRIPPEKEGYVHALGLLLLFGFMIFVTYKDIVRLITG